MIYKKSPEELQIMREGSKILVDTLNELEDSLRPGMTTGELDKIAERRITGAGARASFKGYRGFPASICASPNHVIVHGIPGPTRLKDGDIISLDVGVLWKGLHVDSAWTFPVGEVGADARELMKVTAASLDAAIEQIQPGKRLGDVGHAIESTAAAAGFSIVREYVGHGVGRSLHEDPQIPNYGPPGRRQALTSGMTIAVEPMINLGGERTKVLGDGWTVETLDGSLSAHFEHTVAVTDDGHEVLTLRS